MQYKIAQAENDYLPKCINKLEEEVKKHLNMGWKLQGGVSIATEKHGYTVSYNACQAMIKED